MSPVHSQRFVTPPETIAELGAGRGERRWHLVRGRVLPLAPPPPPATHPLTLPFELPAPDAILARADLEEVVPYERPRLLTVERGRDFYIADEHTASAPALVRVSDDEGRLHPDVELHLGAPFVEHELRPGPASLRAFVRLIAVGEPVYVLGRARVEPIGPDEATLLAGLRDTPVRARFSPELGPLLIYDEPAFQRLAAWYALPWYRKLSLLVRNR